MLLAANATVTTCHSRTRDLAGVCRRADVLVAAVGVPELIKGDWIKEGAVVIDVGMNRTPEKLIGDVEFESAAERALADHARPRRRRPDDDRDAAAQHARSGEGAPPDAARRAARRPRRHPAARLAVPALVRRRDPHRRVKRVRADLRLAEITAWQRVRGDRHRCSRCWRCSRIAVPVVSLADTRPGQVDRAPRCWPARSAGSRSCWSRSGCSSRPATWRAALRRLARARRRAARLGRQLAVAARRVHARRRRPGRAAPPGSARRSRLRSPTDAEPRSGPPRRPPRPPRAHPRGGRALRRRALQGARPHRADRRARRPRGRSAHLARDRRRERAARGRAAPVDARRDGAGERARRGLGGFRVPSPGASHDRADRGARPPQRIKGGDLDAAEYFEFYRERAAARRLQLLHLGRRGDARRATRTRRSRASRSRSRTSSAPRASRARPARRSSRTTARPTRRHRCATSRPPAARCWARPTRTSSRWAPRPRTPPTARR